MKFGRFIFRQRHILYLIDLDVDFCTKKIWQSRNIFHKLSVNDLLSDKIKFQTKQSTNFYVFIQLFICYLYYVFITYTSID